jgi:hypothetical protein
MNFEFCTILTACLVLVACTPSQPRFDIFGEANVSADDMKRYPLNSYRAFPAMVRKTMQLHDIDLRHCWDSTDAEGNSLRACNRSRRTLAALEAKGWCRGSANHISVDDHWMRCRDIPDYSFDDSNSDIGLFDEADIREVARPLRGPVECMHFERNPGIQVTLPLSDVFGSRVFTHDDEKYFPIAYYRSYPRPVQRLMQRSDLESNRCRGGRGDYVETLRACNRGTRIGDELARHGWCWGSIEHVGALDHWMRCRDLGESEPGPPKPNDISFDEHYLREVYQDWKEQRDICLKLLPAKAPVSPLNPPAPGSNLSPQSSPPPRHPD